MPHQTAQAESLSTKHDDILSQFSISKHAFLPSDKPLEVLSDDYYRPWEDIARNLPALVQSGIDGAVAQLPLLDTARLASEAEWQRAYTILTFMTNAYVWSGGKPKEVLPPQVTVPLLRTAAYLELPPILTYAAACLWNFRCSGDNLSDIDSLKTLVSFTGTESESWFILTSVAIEAKAAGLIHAMMAALDAVTARDFDVIRRALEELCAYIQGAGVFLERLHEKCEPMVFYHSIRPFLAGFKGMEDAGLPRGVFYDEGQGRGEWRQLRGGSNGQSSLLQFFDIVLGVDHNTHGSEGKKSYHDEAREYMPGGHRRFLAHAAARFGSLHELAMSFPTSPAQQLMRESFIAARAMLHTFRSKHIKIVTRYIILPSKQPWHGTRRILAEATTSASDTNRQQPTGTGGTKLVSFLKQARDDTNVAWMETEAALADSPRRRMTVPPPTA